MLALLVLTSMAIAAPPPGGSPGATPGAAAASTSGASAGAPGTPAAFFSQSSINFAKPPQGWANWPAGLPVPAGELAHNYYLCYDVVPTADANVPFVLQNVDILDSDRGVADPAKRIPCHSSVPVKNGRPILRGDRLRVAIDMTSVAAKTFFQNVTLLNLNVVLTVAPPIQVTLLRTNLGGTSTAAGLGGNQAPESGDYTQPDYQCFFQVLGYDRPTLQTRGCSGPEIVAKDPASGKWIKVQKDIPKDIMILPWPYTFPGDVIPTIYVSALYTTPQNARTWQPATFYPSGSIVACPGENLCTITSTTGTSRSGASDHEPVWAGPNGMRDGSVIWAPITVDYRLKDPATAPLPDAPDGKPVYQQGDTVVWTSGQTQLEAKVVDWQAQTPVTANTVILCPPPGATMYPLEDERLCSAVAGGTTGISAPQFSTSGIADHDLTWSIDGQKSDQTHRPQAGDIVLWSSENALLQSVVGTWHRQTHYDEFRDVVLCPSGLPAPNDVKLCAAVQSGTSSDTAPASSSEFSNDGTVRWKNGVSWWLQRWQADTTYLTGDGVRCEPAAQKTNLCVASVGGYSGVAEPWWPASSSGPSSPSGAPAAAGAASSSPQRDNQVLWSAFTSATGTPSADQVVNLSSQELTQVHAPDLWGLSTALLYTTKKIPNTYSFAHTVTAGCPTYTPAVPATKTTPAILAVTTPCPDVSVSYQRATDIALMVSPYVFHHFYAKFHDTADGIDVESKWSASKVEDWIPEPIAGFGLNSIGNSYYAGLSLEILVRNLQLVGGYGWIKAPSLTNPVSASGTNTVTPNTYSAYKRAPFIGLAFNIAGLISGH